MKKEMPIRMLRRKVVEEITGLSRSSIYARMEAGTFPCAVNLGGRVVGWIESEVISWVHQKIAAREVRRR